MFVMKKVGRRISELRKRKNMTQVELADRMGVSFQAVSNWERGNSMPDISKLPELAEIFDTSIDDILGAKSRLIEKAAEGTLEEYVENNPVSLDEIKEAAPILKPDQVAVIADKNTQLLCGEDSEHVAPSGDTGLSDSTGQDADEGKLAEDGTCEAKSGDTGRNDIDLEDIEELLPYLDEEAVAKLFKKYLSKGKNVEALLPYMDEDTVGDFAMDIYNRRGLNEIIKYCDYIDEDVVGEIAETEAEKNGLSGIVPLIDYIDEDKLGEIVLSHYRKNGIDGIYPFLDNIDEDIVAEIACDVVKKGGIKAIKPLLPFVDEDVISELVKTIL